MKTESIHQILFSNLMSRPLFESRNFGRRSLVASVIAAGYQDRLSESILLEEGLSKGLAKDAIQFVLSGAAEYGLSVTGAGAPAAPVAETVIDALFAADAVASAVASVKDIASSAGNFSNLLNDSLDAAKSGMGNLNALYKRIKDIVTAALKVLGKGVTAKVDELVDSLKEKIDSMLSSLTDAIVEGIKTVIPDATIGGAVSAAIRALVSKLAENSFDLFSGVIKKAGKYSSFITDPEVAPKFIQDVLGKLSEMCTEMSQKSKELNLLSGPQGIILKKLGESGLSQLGKFIDEKTPDLVTLVKTITSVVIPAFVACLALFQILLKKEYKAESEGEEAKKSSEPPKPKEAPAEPTTQTDHYVRRNSLISDNVHRRDDLDVLLYKWSVSGKNINRKV